MQNKINYVDWVTPNYNLGEEALYLILQHNFTKYNIKLSRITDRINQEHRQTTIIGGGSCLPLITVFTRPTKYMYIFGSGIQYPLYAGQINQPLIDRFKSLNCRLIGVRGKSSKIFLDDWGIDSKVIGDPCLSLKPKHTLERSSKRITINIGDAGAEYSSKSRSNVVKELAKVSDVLKDEGYELIIVPFWKGNMKDVYHLAEKARIRIFTEWQDIGATMNLLSSSKLFIGEKLHSLVFSAAAYTPFVGLAYAPEHFDFVNSVGFSEYTMPITKITAEQILGLCHTLFDKYDSIQSKLESRVNEYREKQDRFAEEICSDFNSLPEDRLSTQGNYGYRLLLRADKQFYVKTGKLWNIWSRAIFSKLTPYLI